MKKVNKTTHYLLKYNDKTKIHIVKKLALSNYLSLSKSICLSLNTPKKQISLHFR